MTNTYKRTNLKNDDPLVINNITTPNNVIPSKDYGMNVIETVDLSDIVQQSNHTDLLNGSYALPQAPVYYSSTGYSAAVTDFENKYQISIDKLEAAKAEYEDKVYVLENLSLQMPDDSFARYQVSYKEDIDYWIQYIKDMGENNEAKLAMQKFGWTTEDLATKSNEELLKIASLNDQDYQDTMETYKEYFAPLKDLGLIEGDYAAFGEIDQLLAENRYYLSLVEAELKTQRYKQSTVKYDLILETESYQNIKDSLPEEPINAPTADTKDTLLFMNNFNPKFTQIYNYLYQTQGYEAAYAYISDITDEMNQFRGMKQANERIDKLILANEEDIKAIETQFASLDTSNATNVKKFLNFVSSKVDDTSVQTLINEFDYNDKDNINQNLQKIVEEVNGVSRLKTMSLTNFGLTAGTGFMDGLYDFGEGYAKIFSKGEITVQDYEEMYYANYLAEHSKYYDDIYGVGQGVGNMLPTTVTGAILYATAPEIAPFVTGSMIAGSSFGTTKNQMLYEGYDAKTAMLYAGLTAGSDALLEVVFGGVEGVGVTAKSAFGSAEKVTFRNLALHQLREMVQEGGEEVLQDLVKSGAIDTIVLGKTFDLGEFTEQSAKTFFQSAMVAGVLNTSTAPINIAVNGVKHSLNQQEIMRLHEMINNGQGYQSSLQTIISEQNNSRLADDEFYQFSLQHPGMTTEALNTLYQQYKNNPQTESTIELDDAFIETRENNLRKLGKIKYDMGNADLNTVNEILNGYGIYSQIDPVDAASLNAKYKELTGEDHPVFMKNQLEVINKYLEIDDTASVNGNNTYEMLKNNITGNGEGIAVYASAKDSFIAKYNNIKYDIGNADLDTVNEILNHYGENQAVVSGVINHFSMSPVVGASLNARYKALTGEDHPVFMANQLDVINRYSEINGDSEVYEFLKNYVNGTGPTIEILSSNPAGNLYEISNNLEDATIEDIDGLLNYYNKTVIANGIIAHGFNDLETAERLNARYKELTGQDHPVFLEEHVKNIENLLSQKDTLLRAGVYTQEYFDHYENVLKSMKTTNDNNVDEKYETTARIVNVDELEGILNDEQKYNEILNSLVEKEIDQYKTRNKAMSKLNDIRSKLFDPDSVSRNSVSNIDYNGRQIPVITVDNLSFDMLVSGISQSTTVVEQETNEILNKIIDNPELWMDMNVKGENQISASYINEANYSKTYGRDVILGFSKIDEGQITDYYNADGHTSAKIKDAAIIEPNYYNIAKFVKPGNDLKMQNYNEFRLNRYKKASDGSLTKYPPSYILQRNHISDRAKKWADYYNIPIVYIDGNSIYQKALNELNSIISNSDSNHILTGTEKARIITLINAMRNGKQLQEISSITNKFNDLFNQPDESISLNKEFIQSISEDLNNLNVFNSVEESIVKNNRDILVMLDSEYFNLPKGYKQKLSSFISDMNNNLVEIDQDNSNYQILYYNLEDYDVDYLNSMAQKFAEENGYKFIPGVCIEISNTKTDTSAKVYNVLNDINELSSKFKEYVDANME